MRSGPRGQAYIVSGNQAVQLELLGGHKLVIGYQRPKELARKIAEAQRQRDVMRAAPLAIAS